MIFIKTTCSYMWFARFRFWCSNAEFICWSFPGPQGLYCEFLRDFEPPQTRARCYRDFSLLIRLNVTRLAGLLWQKAWLILTLYFPGCTASHRLVERMSSVWRQSDLGRSTDDYERSTVDSWLMLHQLITALNICCWYLVLPGRSEKIATYTKLRNLYWLTWLK